MPEMMLTAKEAAGLLNVSKKTVYRLYKRGKFATLKIGGRHRISRQELERFVQAETTAKNRNENAIGA